MEYDAKFLRNSNRTDYQKVEGIVVFGPILAGKGRAMGVVLDEHPNYRKFETGPMFRNPATPELAAKLKEVPLGGLVPDNIVIPLFLAEMKKIAPQGMMPEGVDLFAYDGIPRTINQVYAFSQLVQPRLVIHLDAFSVPRQKLITRRPGRVLQDLSEGRKSRDDDKSDAVAESRMGLYETNTLPAINYFSSDIVERVEAWDDAQSIDDKIRRILRNRNL